MWWIIGTLAVWLMVLVFALALCRAAAWADERMEEFHNG